MSDSSIQAPPGFSELSKAEQVEYLQLLWNQISEHPDEIPVRESHIRLVEERLRHYRTDPSTSQPAFDVIERLTNKKSDKVPN